VRPYLRIKLEVVAYSFGSSTLGGGERRTEVLDQPRQSQLDRRPYLKSKLKAKRTAGVA
jgi:hypothetical protein